MTKYDLRIKDHVEVNLKAIVAGVSHDGTYTIEFESDGSGNGSAIRVPRSALTKAVPPPKVGQVWENAPGERYFVTDVPSLSAEKAVVRHQDGEWWYVDEFDFSDLSLVLESKNS